MSKWKSYEKLLETREKWEIYDLLKKGLQPHDPFSKKKKLIPCPNSLHEYYRLYDKELKPLSDQLVLFTLKHTDLEIIEKKISQEGFILVQDRSLLVDRLDRLTDIKVICDKCFGQLRQEDGRYRITAQEIETLNTYRSKVFEKHNEVHDQITKIRVNDPNLNSWRNLIELTSEEDKKKFDDCIRQAVFLQDELEKVQNEQKSLTDLEENANGEHKSLSGKADNTIKQIPTPDGTQWHDINIHFKDYDKVTIKIGNQKIDCDYKKLGFADCRSKKPKQGWKFLYAMGGCSGNPTKEIENLSKKVSDLNKALKNIFPKVSGKPFKSYVRGLGWQPKINITFSKNFKNSLT